jgi:hypothetical protein
MATNVRLSGAQAGQRSECDIRLNYGNPLQLAGSCNSTGTTNEQFYSADGGVTWSQSNLPSVTGDSRQGDPAVDWTSDGTAWALVVGIGATGNVVRSFKSTDAAHATWTFDATLSGAQTNVDKPVLWVDHRPTSPYKDNLYALWWTPTDGNTYLARRAGPGGAWQAPQTLSAKETSGGSDGGDIKTNAFGDVFAFWPSIGTQQLYVRKSTDGGATFGAPVLIAGTNGSYLMGVPAEAGRGCLIYISAAAYRTAAKDMVYAVWMDLAGGPGCNSPANAPGSNTASPCKTRIFFSRSKDGGKTWSTPVKINDQASLNDQFFPRLAVDDNNGDLAVVYYDTVADAARDKTDVWMQSSGDDGASWSAAVTITTAQTDETVASAGNRHYGDYLGLTGYKGQYFACWTDRRSGGSEEIWGAPFRLVQKACTLIINRSTLGQDEIDARRKQPRNTLNGLPVPDAIRVTVDGFTAAEIGVTSPGSTLTIASPKSGMTINCTGNTSDSGDYGSEVQRFTFYYTVDFPDDSAFGFVGLSEFETVNVAIAGVSDAAQIELVKQPNPFILHGDPGWLSVDMRVFVVRPGDTWFGVTFPENGDATAAPPFIKSVISALTAGQGAAGGQSFGDPNVLSPEEDKSKLYISTYDNNDTPVYNFALAKVHYIGLSGATGVRVFFRLFQTQTTYVPFDYPPGGRYRRALNNPHGQPIPLAGIEGPEYVTIPCFAEARVDTKVKGMDQQTDDPNVQAFVAHADGSEVDGYFGCWLDTNQPIKPDGTANTIIPLQPPSSNVDGPYIDPTIPQVTLQGAIIRNAHQCLIAEIAFDGVPVPVGKDPSNWDKLAQRNITWSDLGSAQALTTFEIRPTPAGLPPGKTPDELMIDWGDVPDGSFASIYLPAVNVDDILSMAGSLYTSRKLVRIDDHTLGCRTGGVTFIPIPAGPAIGYAGLLSIDPSSPVAVGQVFKVSVRQLTNASAPAPQPPPRINTPAIAAATTAPAEIEWRRVLGAFQLTIPVKVKNSQLLRTEERELSVLRWIAQSIHPANRWYPVFHRYLDRLGQRVRAFGGDPDKVPPSPTGQVGGGRHHRHHEKHEGEEREAFTGKITGLIFDRFGDFEGFLLDTEEREREFFSRERDIEKLAERVWRERLRITVWTERDSPHRPLSIIVRQPPTPFQD